MKKTLSLAILLASFLSVAFFACQDHAVDPTNPGGTTGPGSTTSATGTSSIVDLASSLTVTSVMSSSASTNATCATFTGLAKVVCLAQAFEATLSTTQLASVQLTYSLTNAQKWSNLPANLSARYGVNLASLSTTQLAAFRALMVAIQGLGTVNEGYDELLGNLVADNYLYSNGGGAGYGAGDYFVSIVGTPSTTGLWEILYTGHHYTQPYTFNGPTGSGYTPAFRGVEPTAVVSNTATGQTYQPMEQERLAFAAMLTGLNSSEQTAAKLSGTYSDLVLGPGQDWKFPTTKSGLQVSTLSVANQALVLNAIKLYVNDLDATTAAMVLAKYTSEMANTYIAFSGTTTVTAQNDYIRIDGPSVWIEFSYQGGVVIRSTPHPYSVWRDHTTDYGGTK
ncbi:DUF3500 domain-containing protein [Spirosoma flavum]|uniref:DUF3500 domain-containing protein n=1 Tax=Spirosoma flavum TaxID=2048557 RepID=A0ABW6ATR8_9BACT